MIRNNTRLLYDDETNGSNGKLEITIIKKSNETKSKKHY